MNDEECPQCGAAFQEGEAVARQEGMCPDGVWHPIIMVHWGICFDDHNRQMPRYYTLNRLAGARRMN